MRNIFVILALLLGLFLGSPAAEARKISPPFDKSKCKGADILEAYRQNEKNAVSCTRSKWDQIRIYKRYGARQAAAPGHSRHEAGCACDFHSRDLHGGTRRGHWLSNGHGHTGNHLSDTGH
jgi:hypothetical protein